MLHGCIEEMEVEGREGKRRKKEHKVQERKGKGSQKALQEIALDRESYLY